MLKTILKWQIFLMFWLSYFVGTMSLAEHLKGVNGCATPIPQDITCHPTKNPCQAGYFCKVDEIASVCKANLILYHKALQYAFGNSVLRSDQIKNVRVSEQLITHNTSAIPPELAGTHSRYRVWVKRGGNGEVAVNFTLDGEIDTAYPMYGIVPTESRSSVPWGNSRFFLPQVVNPYFNGELNDQQAHTKVTKLFLSSPTLSHQTFRMGELTKNSGATGVRIWVPYFQEIEVALELPKIELALKPTHRTGLRESWVQTIREIEFPQYTRQPERKIGEYDGHGRVLDIEPVLHTWEFSIEFRIHGREENNFCKKNRKGEYICDAAYLSNDKKTWTLVLNPEDDLPWFRGPDLCQSSKSAFDQLISDRLIKGPLRIRCKPGIVEDEF